MCELPVHFMWEATCVMCLCSFPIWSPLLSIFSRSLSSPLWTSLCSSTEMAYSSCLFNSLCSLQTPCRHNVNPFQVLFILYCCGYTHKLMSCISSRSACRISVSSFSLVDDLASEYLWLSVLEMFVLCFRRNNRDWTFAWNEWLQPTAWERFMRGTAINLQY